VAETRRPSQPVAVKKAGNSGLRRSKDGGRITINADSCWVWRENGKHVNSTSERLFTELGYALISLRLPIYGFSARPLPEDQI
jgi:hypothetical protein